MYKGSTPPTLEETELVNRFQNGDEKAFNEIHNRYKLLLCFFTLRIVQDDDVAKSIVSDTMLKLWNLHEKFPTLPKIRGFLYTVCYREACDYYKSKKRRKEIFTGNIEQFINQYDTDHNIIVKIAEAELAHRMFEQIKKLPPRRQKVLLLFYKEGMSTREVARELDMFEDVVRNTKAQALAQLREQLGISINDQRLILLLLMVYQCKVEVATC